jgi:DNA-binding transcriptional MerR regulator
MQGKRQIETPTENADHTESDSVLSDIFHNPKFSIKNLIKVYPSLTYRKLNHWESTGLIRPHRDTKGVGWRFFSYLDLVSLVLIDKLKQFGIRTDTIRIALEALDQRQEGGMAGPECPVSKLEFGTLISGMGETTSLVVFKSGICLLGRTAEDVGPQLIHSPIEEPFMMHPFNEIVNVAHDAIGSPQKNKAKKTSILNPKLVKLLETIREGGYEKIEIALRDGEIRKLKPTRRKSGKVSEMDILDAIRSGSFKNIRVSVGKNKDFILTEEEVVNL